MRVFQRDRPMQMTAEQIWKGAQDVLQTMLNSDIYNLWFAPVRAAEMGPDSITLTVPNDFCELWLKDNYLGLIQDVLGQVTGRQLSVQFRVNPEITAEVKVGNPPPASAKHTPKETP